MKKATGILALIILLVCGHGYAQENEFDLSDYKLPYLKRSTLDLNFGLRGQNDYRLFYGDADENTNKFNNQISAYYSFYLNSEEYQREYDVRFSNYLHYDKNVTYDRLTNKTRGWSPSLNGNLVNRKYFENVRFLEYDVAFNHNTDLYRSYTYPWQGDENESGRWFHSTGISLPLKMGKGRIEQVQDARHAVYIYDELAAINRVSGQKSDEEIIQLAQLISEIKNERFFDARLKRIYQLEALDSFLVAKDFVLDYDGSYFAVLNDYWQNSGLQIRESGERFSLAMIPTYSRHVYKFNYFLPTEEKSESYYDFFSLYAGAEFKREKPINLTWQNSINAHAYVGFINRIYEDSDNVTRSPNAQLGFRQSFGYYPNSRTSAILGYNLQYYQVLDTRNDDDTVLSTGGFGFGAATDLSVNYYISPQFRLSFTHHLSFHGFDSDVKDNNYTFPQSLPLHPNPSWGWNYHNTKRSFSNYFNLTLTYSLF